jgi:hypothetical protein
MVPCPVRRHLLDTKDRSEADPKADPKEARVASPDDST